MLPVRHLDSSASLCRWQRASLWWNNGANCPWWTGDQTSASKIHELEMFFSVPSNFECNWWKKREIEESTQRSSFKIWFYQTVLSHTSIVLWHLDVPCDMAGCETIWLEGSHNSSNSVAKASTGTFHSHIDTARPLKHPNWGKLTNSNTQKIHGNGVILNLFASCDICGGRIFISSTIFHKYPSTVETRVSSEEEHFSHGINVNWFRHFTQLSSHAMPVISIPRRFSWAEELKETLKEATSFRSSMKFMATYITA